MKLKQLSALAVAGVIVAGMAMTGCGSMDPDIAVATVNSIPIRLGLANFVAQYTAVDYDAYYMSYFSNFYKYLLLSSKYISNNFITSYFL